MTLPIRNLGTLITVSALATACQVQSADTDSNSGGGILTTTDPTTTGDESETGAGPTGDGDGDPTTTTTTTEGDGDGDPGSEGGAGPKFDIGGLPDASGAGGCLAPLHNPCDDDDDDYFHALGINCPGELEFVTSYTGHADAVYVQAGQLGTYDPPTYPVLEGDKMLILSSGIAQELTVPALYASTSNAGNDPGQNLPAPINMNAVDPGFTTTCTDDPDLIGTGDCSNTLQEQWEQGSGANDYAELRISGEVPGGASGFSYNLAFFSTEYPNYYQSTFNDMYVAWLQSEAWTGNVSFDEMGAPISLNAGFLDYKDAPNDYDCPNPCTAPELQGTAMEGHAGTKWLTTSAGVVPGEQFELLFSIFDLSDGILDSVVILDNFMWNCEGGPPVTIPG